MVTTVSAFPLYLWVIEMKYTRPAATTTETVREQTEYPPPALKALHLRLLGRHPRLESAVPQLCLLLEGLSVSSTSKLKAPSYVWQRLHIRCRLAPIMRSAGQERRLLLTMKQTTH